VHLRGRLRQRAVERAVGRVRKGEAYGRGVQQEGAGEPEPPAGAAPESATDTEPVERADTGPEPGAGDGPGPGATWVVGDVHGHRDELVAELHRTGLTDADGDWTGGTDRLWFLGDFFDRGPSGVAVVEQVMRLSEQAAEAGGAVHALLGNHEILALGMHRFGDTEVPSDFGPRSFERSWKLNGGLAEDQSGLTDEHVDWLTSRPVLGLAADHLLMHSDTVEYFSWGESIEEINAAVGAVLAGDDLTEWWECWRRMTTRYAFRGPHGVEVATEVLANLGGSRIVHGHSVIADQLGVAPADLDGPHSYADDLVLGVDGGLFVGGPCLVVALPWIPDGKPADEPLDHADDESDADTDDEPDGESDEPDAAAGDEPGPEPEDEPADGSGVSEED
jgi:Calcineurin-like phosphoesterase